MANLTAAPETAGVPPGGDPPGLQGPRIPRVGAARGVSESLGPPAHPIRAPLGVPMAPPKLFFSSLAEKQSPVRRPQVRCLRRLGTRVGLTVQRHGLLLAKPMSHIPHAGHPPQSQKLRCPARTGLTITIATFFEMCRVGTLIRSQPTQTNPKVPKAKGGLICAPYSTQRQLRPVTYRNVNQ